MYIVILYLIGYAQDVELGYRLESRCLSIVRLEYH